MTGRGWALTLAGAVMILGGWLLGIPEFYALGIAALTLVATAAAYVGLWFPKITADHRLVANRVGPGQPSALEITVINHGRRSTPPLVATDPVADTTRWRTPHRYPPRLVVPPIAGAATTTTGFALFTGQRGKWPIGPLAVGLGDRFGLVERLRIMQGPVTLTVYPQIDALRSLPPATRPLSTSDAIDGPPTGDGGEQLAWVRPYQVGDDLRRIHWASTARHDELMVRHGELPATARLTLVGDLRHRLHDPSSFESALEALASLAMTAWRSGSRLRLIATDGFDSGWRGQGDQLTVILDHLAGAGPHTDGSGSGHAGGPNPGGLGPALAALAGSGYGAAVVVTSAAIDDRESAACRTTLAPFDPGVLMTTVR